MTYPFEISSLLYPFAHNINAFMGRNTFPSFLTVCNPVTSEYGVTADAWAIIVVVGKEFPETDADKGEPASSAEIEIKYWSQMCSLDI